MATVPLSGTNIRLLSGVPFSNDYKNTRWFDNEGQQITYFSNKPTTYIATNHTFQRIEGRSFISVKKSIDELWDTNYLMFQNTDYNSKWFYAFVTKLEYVQKNTTYVHFEIDVFQTWRFEMNFKPSFVVREHCKLWNTDGTPIINTVDEGLNYGTEYETVSVKNYKPNNGLLFLVIVSKSSMHASAVDNVQENDITPILNGTPQPLSYYVHPFRNDGTIPTLQIGGQTKPLSPILKTLQGMFTHDDTVNNIVSMYVTDYFGRWVNYDGTIANFDSDAFKTATIADNKHENVDTVYVSNIPEYDAIDETISDKYFGYDIGKESKLLMYPYTVTVLDDFRGNRINIKNEYIEGMDLKLRVKGSLSTSNKVSYSVENYLTASFLDFDEKLTVDLENALINNSPNDVSILSDYLSAYLQGNKNQIENQKQAIMFNGTIGALTGGMVGMAQSNHQHIVGKGRSQRLANFTNPFGASAAGLQAATGVGQAVIEMQGLQAKQNDISNTPPQLVKMGGNSAYDFGNGYNGIFIIKKQITKEYRKKLEDFFNMFGYKVNEVKLPNFHTRMNWNYVQTTNCNITGNLNHEDLTELKSVFDGGITLWHTDDVGNYALENEVI